jgi:hypothetical protein
MDQRIVLHGVWCLFGPRLAPLLAVHTPHCVRYTYTQSSTTSEGPSVGKSFTWTVDMTEGTAVAAADTTPRGLCRKSKPATVYSLGIREALADVAPVDNAPERL